MPSHNAVYDADIHVARDVDDESRIAAAVQVPPLVAPSAASDAVQVGAKRPRGSSTDDRAAADQYSDF